MDSQPARGKTLRSAWRGELGRFAVVGAASTVVQLGLFAALHVVLDAQPANFVALVLSTVFNTSVNGSWTFRERRGTGRPTLVSQLLALGVFGLTWAATSLALTLVDAAVPDASLLLKILAVAAGTAASTVVRFLAMRHWIFARPAQ